MRVFRPAEHGKRICVPNKQHHSCGNSSHFLRTLTPGSMWASVMSATQLHLHPSLLSTPGFTQLPSPELLREQDPDPCRPQKILQIGHGRCVPSVRQTCTLIPGAPVFQDHASVSCHLFNEALWCGQWFGKLAKYKMQTKQEDNPAQLEGYCLRNRASTLSGAHSQLALHRNDSGHQGTWINEPVSKWPTQGGKILIQVNVILISLPGF